MLLLISIVAITALILIVAEMLIPGFGIFGVLGFVLLISSTVSIANIYGILAFLISLAVLAILFFMIFIIAKKTGLADKFILNDKQDANALKELNLEDLVGKIGKTKTDLKPFGVMDIDGIFVDVSSFGEFIERNKTIEVVQIIRGNVIVKEV